MLVAQSHAPRMTARAEKEGVDPTASPEAIFCCCTPGMGTGRSRSRCTPFGACSDVVSPSTTRGDGTKARSLCVPSLPYRATGTYPEGIQAARVGRMGVPHGRSSNPEPVGPRNSVRVPLIQVRPLSAGCRRVWASDRIEAVRAIAPEVRQGAAQLAAAVLDSQPVSLCGEFVFVEQPAEPVTPTNSPLVVGRRDGPDLRERRVLVERAVWPMRVVVGDVLAQNGLELPAGDDQDAVETFTPGAADPALGVRFRPGPSDRRLDKPESLGTKDLVEGGREFAVAVADQDPMPLLLLGERHRQVARLLHDPGSVGIGGDTGEIHATPRQIDEEEHVEPAQPKRLDRKEVTLEDYGCLLAQELPPADPRSPRCGLDPVAVENVPNTARRKRQPERDQLALDALVAPARVLRRQTQNQLLHLRVKGANIRVAPLPGVAWEDRRHGFRVPLPRR